jgi:uncharacterized protein (PEP-CTERM system associated)
MAITAMDTTQKHKTLYLLILLVITSLTSKAGEWKFKPALTADETYSDNINRTTTNEKSSLISQLGIDISTSYQAKHASFELSSTSTYALNSHDHERDNDFHTLNSRASFLLWPNGIALTAGATVGNQSSNNATQGFADIISGNTVQVENYQAGLAYNINNSHFSLSSNINYNINQSEDNIGERKGYNTNINAKNGTRAKLIFWDLNAQYQDNANLGRSLRVNRGEVKVGLITGYKFQPFLRYYKEDSTGSVNSRLDTALTSYGVGVRWLLFPRLIIDIAYNKPKGNPINSRGRQQEENTSVNIDWQPSIRTTISANYSQRFFGDSYMLNLNHKNRRLTNTISYQENLEAFTRNRFDSISLGSFWCPVAESTNTNNCFITDDSIIDFENYQLVNLTDFIVVEDNQPSLNKILQWSSTLTLARTTFSLTLNGQNREDLSTHIEDKNINARLSINRKISGNSTLSFTSSFRENNINLLQENELTDRYRQYQLMYQKSLNQNLSTSLAISTVSRSSSSSRLDYKEGRITYKVNKGF